MKSVKFDNYEGPFRFAVKIPIKLFFWDFEGILLPSHRLCPFEEEYLLEPFGSFFIFGLFIEFFVRT